MPAPTEEQVLTQILRQFEENSQISKNLKLQKWLMLLVAFITGLAVFIGYKYACFSNLWLISLSFFSGMSFVGWVLTHQGQYQTELIKPYIDLSAIKERINEIKI
jgi:hypothetical protein